MWKMQEHFSTYLLHPCSRPTGWNDKFSVISIIGEILSAFAQKIPPYGRNDKGFGQQESFVIPKEQSD
jgi:hypothetical protein